MISLTTLTGAGLVTSIDVTLLQPMHRISIVPLRVRGTLKALPPQ